MKWVMNMMLCMEMNHTMNRRKMDHRMMMQLRTDWRTEKRLLNHTLVKMMLMDTNRTRMDGKLMRNQMQGRKVKLPEQRRKEMNRVIRMMGSMNHYRIELLSQRINMKLPLRLKNTSS